MKIEEVEENGKPRRKFFLLMEVTFADRPREYWDQGENYYDDDEMPERIAAWARSAIDDRDDSPRARFMALPEVLDVDVQSVARGDYPGHVQEEF